MTTENQSPSNYMPKNIFTFLAFVGCVLLLVYCSKDEPEIDFSDPLSFNCNSSPLICTRPDSLGPFGEMDCDNGGISSFHECIAKTDFNDPSDDCSAAVKAKVDICLLLQVDRDSVELGFRSDMILSDEDCDEGGISNYQECILGFNPIKPNDRDEENGLLDDKEIEAYLKETTFLDSLIQDSIGIIASNDSLNIFRTESGAFSIIESMTEGASPTVQDSIIYRYSSSYIDNCLDINDCIACLIANNCVTPSPCQVIPHESDVLDTAQVSNLVLGIQEGISQFKGRSKGTVVVPSRLAYGSEGAFGIPEYSVLIIDIEVDTVF